MISSFLKNKFEAFFFFKSYIGNRVYLQIVLSVLIGLLDSLGLTLFIPLLAKLNSDNSVISDDDSSIWINKFVEIFDLTLFRVLLFIIFFFVLKGIVIYFYNVYFAVLRRKLMTKVRKELIVGVDNMEYSAFTSLDAGKIQNTFVTDSSNVSAAYSSYFSTIQQLIFIIIYVGFSLFVDYQFAIIIIIAGILSNFLFKKLYTFTKKLSSWIVGNYSNFQSLIIQYIQNYKYLKATNANKTYIKHLFVHNDLIEKNNIKLTKVSSVVTATREPILIVIISITILIQVKFLGGKLSAILLVLMFFYKALGYVISTQTVYNSFLGTYGSLNSIMEMKKFLTIHKETINETALQSLEKGFDVRNLSFCYRGSDKKILNNISLSIKKNQTIGIVGESGSGKTTFVNILCGLLKVDRSAFFIDDNDINDIDILQYREKIGYITQEAVIFNDTIFNNITFWAQKTPENTDRFWAACRLAKIEDLVKSYQKLEDEQISHNGVNISGGQKQRLSIARELYKNSEILVLDEATSALDSESEDYIKKNIDALKGKLTTIIIAHRLSTIKSADVIFIFNQGKIDDQGTFDELYSRSQYFKRMVDLQKI